jgi:predicted amino acid racemase
MHFPVIRIHRENLVSNANNMITLCKRQGIDLCGVIKGVNAYEGIVSSFASLEFKQLGSSRITHLKTIKETYPDVMTMLLRIPMLCELESVVDYSDITLVSEKQTLEQLNEIALLKKREIGVLLMYDLGDLREGFLSEDELVHIAVYVEKHLHGLRLSGVGTNLGCYGGIRPTSSNLSQLVLAANRVEKHIGRKLDIISGGATSSIPLLIDGAMPKGINHLRIGEGVLLNRDLPDFYKVSVPHLNSNTMKLVTQIVEVKVKPSHPIGEIFIDAFGDSPSFIDKGIRIRAIAAIGKQDLGDPMKLIVCEEGVEIVGSSSDHLILDVTDAKRSFEVGSQVSFDLYYGPMLHAFTTEEVHKIMV